MARKRRGIPRRSYYKKKFFFSIRERMLLHLSMYTQYENELEVPDEITQFGIADVVRAGRSTCSKILQEMEDKGWLYGRRAHVPSGKIRRTAYFLTPRGRIEAAKVREKVERTRVKVKTPSGELKKLRVVDIPRELSVYGTLVDAVVHISRAVFDVKSFVKRVEAKRGGVAYVASMPRIPRFVDREGERKALGEWMDSPSQRVLVLHGLPGIGKTTMAAKLVNDERKDRNVFWYSCREWSTPRHVVRELGGFLARLNKTNLLRYVDTHEVLDMNEALFLLEKNLGGTKPLLVFDDYDKAGGALEGLFGALKEITERQEGPKLLITSRTIPKFYDRRDVEVKKSVGEMALEGLDRDGVNTLLALKNIPEEDFQAVFQKTRGHPLFIELIREADASDIRDVEKFLDEQLYGRLLDVEKRVISLASAFRKPVHVDALLMEEGVDFVVVTSLSDQSLLREASPRVYDLHDMIRSFFYERLGSARRKKYHGMAARYYVSRGGPEDFIEAIHHLTMSDSVEPAARAAVQYADTILRAGLLESFSNVLRRLKERQVRKEREVELDLLEGRILSLQGELEKALPMLKSIAETAKRMGQRQVEAEARLLMGEALLNKGEKGAEDELEKSLKLYGKQGNLDGQANAHYSLGFLRNRESEFMEAYRHFRKGMRLALQSGDRLIQARLLYAFGVNYAHRGNYPKSVSYKVRAMEILEELRDLHELAKVYTGLGPSYQELGDRREAMRYYEKGIEFARLIGDQRILAYALQNAAGTPLLRDDLAKAEELLTEATAIFRRIGEKRKIAWSQLYLGHLDFARGRADAAVGQWEGGLKQLATLKDKRGLALFNLTIARVYIDEGDVVQAEKYLNVADKIGRDLANGVLLSRVSEERESLASIRRGSAPSPSVPSGSESSSS